MSDPRAPWLDDTDLPEDLAAALGQLRSDDVAASQVSRLHARLAPMLGWPDPSAISMPAPDGMASTKSIGTASTAPAAAPVVASVAPAALGVSAAVTKLIAVPWLVVSATVATSGAFGWLGYQYTMEHSQPAARQQEVVDEAPTVTSHPTHEARVSKASPIGPAQPGSVTSPTTTPTTSDTMAARPARPQTTPSLEDEARLLKHAQAELVTAPERALQLTQEHARRFRRGVLTQEREALAIEALARLGRQSEARRRLQQFTRDYPGSPHARRVAESLTPE